MSDEKLDLIQKNLKAWKDSSEDTKKNNQEAIDSITKSMEDLQKQQLEIRQEGESNFKKLDGRFANMGNVSNMPNQEEIQSYRKSMREYLLSNGKSRIVTDVNKSTAQQIVNKTMGFIPDNAESVTKSYLETANPTGGYLVRPELSSNFIDRSYETSPMRLVANVVSCSSESMNFVVKDNLPENGGWVKEGSTISPTEGQTFGFENIKAHKLVAYPFISEEMMSDSFIDIENLVLRDVQESMTLDENRAFIVGDSINKPRGILDYEAWNTAGEYQRGAIEQINSGTNGKVTFDGLVSMQNSLLEVYQPRAVWLMNRSTFGEVCKLKDQNGQPYVGGYGKYLRDGTSIDVPMILNKPVIFCSDMPVISSGSLSIAYGDFNKGYTILDRMGMSVLQNPYTNPGQMGFYFRKRVGGACTNYQSIKLMKLSA